MEKHGRLIDKDFAARIIKRVAELSDRTSPDDWPEAMLVTGEELKFIIDSEIEDRPTVALNAAFA